MIRKLDFFALFSRLSIVSVIAPASPQTLDEQITRYFNDVLDHTDETLGEIYSRGVASLVCACHPPTAERRFDNSFYRPYVTYVYNIAAIWYTIMRNVKQYNSVYSLKALEFPVGPSAFTSKQLSPIIIIDLHSIRSRGEATIDSI